MFIPQSLKAFDVLKVETIGASIVMALKTTVGRVLEEVFTNRADILPEVSSASFQPVFRTWLGLWLEPHSGNKRMELVTELVLLYEGVSKAKIN